MHYWVTKFRERVKIGMEAKELHNLALDETIIKVNGRQFYLYAALDVERNEIVWMRVYSHRNYLTTLNFVNNVLKYCKDKPVFVMDKGPWYKGVRSCFCRNLYVTTGLVFYCMNIESFMPSEEECLEYLRRMKCDWV